jgi:hypothetical protein
MIKHYSVMAGLTDRYNYSEFIAACRAANMEQLPFGEYSAKVVMLDYAVAVNPTLDPLNAYLQEIAANGGSLALPKYLLAISPTPQTLPPADCGNCGGGTVI